MWMMRKSQKSQRGRCMPKAKNKEESGSPWRTPVELEPTRSLEELRRSEGPVCRWENILLNDKYNYLPKILDRPFNAIEFAQKSFQILCREIALLNFQSEWLLDPDYKVSIFFNLVPKVMEISIILGTRLKNSWRNVSRNQVFFWKIWYLEDFLSYVDSKLSISIHSSILSTVVCSYPWHLKLCTFLLINDWI